MLYHESFAEYCMLHRFANLAHEWYGTSCTKVNDIPCLDEQRCLAAYKDKEIVSEVLTEERA